MNKTSDDFKVAFIVLLVLLCGFMVYAFFVGIREQTRDIIALQVRVRNLEITLDDYNDRTW